MLIIYALMRCLPTSYIESLARQRSMQPGSKSYEEWMAQLSAMYGMDKGIFLGYLGWLKDFFRGNFGDSWYYTVPVVQKFHETIWLSFWMGLIAMFFELVIATIGTIATSSWIAAGMAIQKIYLRHYRPINIILALTLLECVYSMLK